MKETMGQIIRRLRKERNLTQEDLAEQLGITFQAVSKWENNTGMPDISQVVPLAHLFGVSTDVLFGMFEENDTEEVWQIVNNAQSLLTHPITAMSLYKKYCALKDGLKLHPNNHILLMCCLETGIALSYPENEELYDAEHGASIYHECIRYANLVITYSQNISDTLRAHMIMVILHAAYGNFNEADFHAEHFPYRADFNNHVMYAYIAHWKKNYNREAEICQRAALYYLEGLLDISTQLALSYMQQKEYADAAITLETIFELIQCIFKDSEFMPALHYRERGDLYMLLAEIYMNDGNIDKALLYLEKMINYDLNTYPLIDSNTQTASPFFSAIPREVFRHGINSRENLMIKLTDPRFDRLKSSRRYQELIEQVRN